MASIDQDRKRISAAILLYGAPGAGKTTSLYALARSLPDGTHGKVAPLNQGDGRLLRLDYRPHDQELVYGFQVNFRLVACPGSIEVDLIRPLLGAIDAVMFVADSSKTALKANIKALELLERLLRSAGRELAELPIVFLYNKRDLRDAVEIRLLEEKLNRFGCNYVAASAVRGQGVLDAVQRLTASVAVQVRAQVQASTGEEGNQPGNAATVAHGSNIHQARSLHAIAGNDDQTAISPEQQPSGRWEGDDDRTELNPGGDWTATADVADPGDLTAPAGGFVPERSDMGSGDWTRPSRGQAQSPAAAFASATSSGSGAFSQLTPLESEAPPAAKPLKSAGSWRTPSAFADDVDADDHTMPFRERAGFGSADTPSPDDITETAFVTSSPAPPPAPRSLAPSPPPPAARPTPAPARAAPAARPASAPRAAPAARAARAQAPAGAASTGSLTPKARRVDRPAAPPAAVPMAAASTMGGGAPAADAGSSGGVVDFTATQVINSLGRQPEAWEASIEANAHKMKVPVADLAGYVVSRIGTPKASTRRTISVPVRATHMDTLMPQDFMLEIDFRGGPGGSSRPPISARRGSDESSGKTIPLSVAIGVLGGTVVLFAFIVAFLVGQIGG